MEVAERGHHERRRQPHQHRALTVLREEQAAGRHQEHRGAHGTEQDVGRTHVHRRRDDARRHVRAAGREQDGGLRRGEDDEREGAVDRIGPCRRPVGAAGHARGRRRRQEQDAHLQSGGEPQVGGVGAGDAVRLQDQLEDELVDGHDQEGQRDEEPQPVTVEGVAQVRDPRDQRGDQERRGLDDRPHPGRHAAEPEVRQQDDGRRRHHERGDEGTEERQPGTPARGSIQGKASIRSCPESCLLLRRGSCCTASSQVSARAWSAEEPGPPGPAPPTISMSTSTASFNEAWVTASSEPGCSRP